MNLKSYPNQRTVKELFDYKDGHLIWRVNHGRSRVKGKIAGSPDDFGVNRIRIEGAPYRAARLVWIYHHGEQARKLLRRDNNPSNDRIENLYAV